MNASELLGKYDIQPGPRGVLEISNASRQDLARFLADIGCKVGAEIGVASGRYSRDLMAANPSLKLYGVDPYTVYEGYKDYALNSTMEKLKAEAHARLDEFPTYEFVYKFSEEALKDFEDESLDFVYIDANHEEPYVTQDIEGWSKKVKKGGVVSGHDYSRVRSITDRYEVVHAVDSFAERHGVQIYIWGLNSKFDPTLVREPIRSWMYIR